MDTEDAPEPAAGLEDILEDDTFSKSWSESLFESIERDAYNGLEQLRSEGHPMYGFISTCFEGYQKQIAALKLETETDPLTHLLNKSKWDRDKGNHYGRALRDKDREDPLGVSLIYLDLNNFKQLNDRRGHDAGDSILHKVGLAIQSVLPYTAPNDPRGKSAFAYRFGGDEFAIVAYTPRENAVKIGERVRKKIEEEVGVHDVTAAVGVVQHSNHLSFDDLAQAADIALYTSKNAPEKNTISYYLRPDYSRDDHHIVMRRAPNDEFETIRYNRKGNAFEPMELVH